MKFTKMHGCGNDYIYVDCFQEKVPNAGPEREAWIRFLSDRHFGIGGDGVILIGPSETADAKMTMYNADGSEGAMCGNGVRCVAKYVYDHLSPKEVLAIETGAGIRDITVVEQAAGKALLLRVDMGEPSFLAARIPTTLPDHSQEVPLVISGQTVYVTPLSTGSTHAVIFVERITDEHIFRLGPQLERHPAFPQRANIEFVEVLSPTELRMRVWERGSGETLACGTGAAAVCAAGVRTGRCERSVTVHLRGGDLQLRWDAQTNHLWMTGPATEVFSGEIELP